MLTAQQYREKHARRLKGSLEDLKLGVNGVTESPTAQAAQKQEKMLANLTAAVQSGKWKAGLSRVSVEEWRSKMLSKGVNRIATGIDEAAGKVEQFAAAFLPHAAAVAAEVAKMSDLTLEDSIARATAAIRGMAKFKR